MQMKNLPGDTMAVVEKLHEEGLVPLPPTDTSRYDWRSMYVEEWCVHAVTHLAEELERVNQIADRLSENISALDISLAKSKRS